MVSAATDKVAIRRTRKDLQQKIRNDWDEVIKQALAGKFDAHDKNLTQPPRDKNNGAILRWQERTYASSDPSSGEDTTASENEEDNSDIAPNDDGANGDAPNGDTPHSKLRSGKKTKAALAALGIRKRSTDKGVWAQHHCMHPDGSDCDGDTSPSGVDTPRESSAAQPSVAEMKAQRREERKRRRRRRLEEEMTWNEGLANWQRTRDIWCRAKHVPASPVVSATMPTTAKLTATASSPTVSPVAPLSPKANAKAKADTQEASSSSSLESNSTTAHAPSTAKTSIEEPRANSAFSPTSPRSPTSPSSAKTHPLSPTSPNSPLPPQPPNETHFTKTLIPIPAPIIPDTDPGRKNLELQYHMIFNKIVLESIPPQVPINLSHLVPALVQGWKDNDEWPPKTSIHAETVGASHATAGGAMGMGMGMGFGYGGSGAWRAADGGGIMGRGGGPRGWRGPGSGGVPNKSGAAKGGTNGRAMAGTSSYGRPSSGTMSFGAMIPSFGPYSKRKLREREKEREKAREREREKELEQEKEREVEKIEGKTEEKAEEKAETIGKEDEENREKEKEKEKETKKKKRMSLNLSGSGGGSTAHTPVLSSPRSGESNGDSKEGSRDRDKGREGGKDGSPRGGGNSIDKGTGGGMRKHVARFVKGLSTGGSGSG